MTKIAIIGTGALGARHLQALARLDGPLRVDLVDPVPAARERALSLLAEVGGISGEVRQFGKVDELSSPPDVAIVATRTGVVQRGLFPDAGANCFAKLLVG